MSSPIVAGLILALTMAPAIASPASLQDPSPTTRLVPYSGALTDAAGIPLTGPQEVSFALFDQSEGGTLLWTETQTVRANAKGEYLAYLGAMVSLPGEIFRTEQARWLQVSAGGRDLPRMMLVAVPYALKAVDAETLGGTPAGAFVVKGADGKLQTASGADLSTPTVDGTGFAGQIAKWATTTTLSSSVITESATNRVGFGLTDPTGGGVVDSVFTIRNYDNNTGFGILNDAWQRRFAINTLATGGWIMYDGGGSTWNAGLTQLSGRAGIGLTLPAPTTYTTGKLMVTPGTEHNGIFIRKTVSDTFRKAIHGRSAVGIGGPVIAGIAGVADNTDWGTTAPTGVYGLTAGASGFGVYGYNATGTGAAVYGEGGQYAGQFAGNVSVTGTLSKGGGSFKIDHPLDPANKYLRHSFVESPDMMDVYNGNVVLDANGEATVTLPDWFETLNRDFRYQLTPIGAPGPNLYVATEVAGNTFKIAGGTPNAKVSWQVTGIRQDAWANANRIVVEEDKPEGERGFYLHPEAIGLSRDMSVTPLAVRATAVQIKNEP